MRGSFAFRFSHRTAYGCRQESRFHIFIPSEARNPSWILSSTHREIPRRKTRLGMTKIYFSAASRSLSYSRFAPILSRVLPYWTGRRRNARCIQGTEKASRKLAAQGVVLRCGAARGGGSQMAELPLFQARLQTSRNVPQQHRAGAIECVIW